MLSAAFGAFLLFSCAPGNAASPMLTDNAPTPDASMLGIDASIPDGSPDERVIPFDPDAMPPSGAFCSLPGSLVSTSTGVMVVPGAKRGSAPDPTTLAWLDVPVGFCAHFFAQVPEVRQLLLRPGRGPLCGVPELEGSCTGGASGRHGRHRRSSG